MFWLQNTFLIMICPSLYVDEDGYALDGYPMIMAKSLELSKMYWGDYSWLENPKSRELSLDMFSFWLISFNVSWGWWQYILSTYVLADVLGFISIYIQMYSYFWIYFKI